MRGSTGPCYQSKMMTRVFVICSEPRRSRTRSVPQPHVAHFRGLLFRSQKTPSVKPCIAPLASGAEAKTLSAHSEQVSLAGGLASTYSCANCCQNSVVDGTVVPGSAGTGFPVKRLWPIYPIGYKDVGVAFFRVVPVRGKDELFAVG